MFSLVLGLLTALSAPGAQAASGPAAGPVPPSAAAPVQEREGLVGEKLRPGQVVRPEERDKNRPKHVMFDDPAAVAAGREALERSLLALGAVAVVGEPGAFQAQVPLVDVIPGFVHQGLYTELVLTQRAHIDPTSWRVHSRVPFFARHAPNGDGYAIGEYTTQASPSEVRFVPVYNRYVVVGERAWSEQAGIYARTQDAEANARWHVMRTFVLGAWPLALQTYAAEMAALEGDPAEDPSYELRFDRKWRPLEHEWIQDYYLVLDRATHVPRQLQFHVVQNDRAHRRSLIQWAFADFDSWRSVPIPEDVRAAWRERLIAAWHQASGREGEVDPDSLRVPEVLLVPGMVTLWRNEAEKQLVMESTRHAFEALPDASLDFPWLVDDRVWSTPERADAWDPPAPSGPPAPEAGASPAGDGG